MLSIRVGQKIHSMNESSASRAVKTSKNKYRGRKVRAMLDISRSLDSISDLVILLAGESTPHHYHIFYLPQTFQLLKIKASRKSRSYISVKPFNGTARSGAFFTLKGLSPKDVHTELESVYMDEAVYLRTVYK
jgi:hypothetical protein